MSKFRSPVGIVGAGPVGIACALRLASLGIPSLLLEAKPGPVKQGSKACLIQGDVLEILDKFGCAAQVAAEGIPWRVGHTYIRGEEVDSMVYPERPGFCEFVNISQFRIEQIMLTELEQNPLCEIRWGTQVSEVDHLEDGVRLHFGRGDAMEFNYVVACDGIRSTLRNLLDVRWTGYTHKDRFLITDIYTELPFTKERHFHFDPPWNPGRQMVFHPQPNGMWRIDWQLAPYADIDQEKKTGALDQRIRDAIGDLPYKIDWLSTYRFNQRVVDQFKVRNVFFAGDSAHALPPYGSRGMNSGIQDIDNLAWKLAHVLRGFASKELLQSYHEERYLAAKENLRITEATIRFMVPPTLIKKLARNALLALSRAIPAFKKFLNSGRMAEPFRYPKSRIVDDADRHPLSGSFLPDMVVSAECTQRRLREMVGDGFVFVCFCRTKDELESFVARSSLSGANCPIVAVLPEGAAVETEQKNVQIVSQRGTNSVSSPFETGGYWYLVRPDGHVASSGDLCGGLDPADALDRCSMSRERTTAKVNSSEPQGLPAPAAFPSQIAAE